MIIRISWSDCITVWLHNNFRNNQKFTIGQVWRAALRDIEIGLSESVFKPYTQEIYLLISLGREREISRSHIELKFIRIKQADFNEEKFCLDTT